MDSLAFGLRTVSKLHQLANKAKQKTKQTILDKNKTIEKPLTPVEETPTPEATIKRVNGANKIMVAVNVNRARNKFKMLQKDRKRTIR